MTEPAVTPRTQPPPAIPSPYDTATELHIANLLAVGNYTAVLGIDNAMSVRAAAINQALQMLGIHPEQDPPK